MRKLIFLLIIALVFAACKEPTEPTKGTTEPALTGTVSITGTAEVGQTLTANTSSLGGSGIITFQWMRGGNVVGSSVTYVLTVADIGSTITVTVARSGYSGSVTSDPTSAVPPILTGTVNISGTTDVGQTLTANTDSLGGSGTISYHWNKRTTNSGTINIGTNSNTYIIQSTDFGSTITVTVTCSGYTSSVTSNPVGPIGFPPLTGIVSISGIAEIGRTLTANTDLLNGNGTVSYQWKRGTTNIGINSTYIIQSADAGSTITVTVTRSGYSGSVPSQAFGPITSIIFATLNNVIANGNETQTTTALTLTFSQVISGLSANDITLNGVSDVQKGTLSNSGSVYTLPISGFISGGTLNVAVAKSGYNISDSPKTVDIYYTPPTVGIVIDLAEINEWELIEQTVQAYSGVNKIFTVSGTYVSYRWYLDGVLVGTSSSFNLYDKLTGVYQLTVVVTNNNGESRSGRCRITVIAPDGSEANPFPLTINTWLDGNITSTTSTVWYSFFVTSGTTYRVWWNDQKQGNGKTLDVIVSATYSNGTSIFTNIDSGWTTARSFTANQAGIVKIKVVPYSNGNTGTFAVAYTTSSTRP